MESDEDDDGRSFSIVLAAIAVGLVFFVIATVIGAAVIGAFVLDLGSSTDAGATVGVSFDETSDGLVVRYHGDDSVDTASLTVEVNGDTEGTWRDLEHTDDRDRAIVLTAVESGDRVTILWHRGGNSFVVGQHDVR